MSARLIPKARIAPGIWVDSADALHFSVPELLALFNEKDTPENRQKMSRLIEGVMAENSPATIVHHIDDCPNCGSTGLGHKPDCPLK